MQASAVPVGAKPHTLNTLRNLFLVHKKGVSVFPNPKKFEKIAKDFNFYLTPGVGSTVLTGFGIRKQLKDKVLNH
jgi:hypothetical protein